MYFVFVNNSRHVIFTVFLSQIAYLQKNFPFQVSRLQLK